MCSLELWPPECADLSPSSPQSGNSFDGPRILRYYTYQDSRKLKEIMAQVSARMAAALARQGPKAAQLSKQVKFKWVSITCFIEIVCSDVKCGLCGEAAITSGHFRFQYSIMNKIIIVDSQIDRNCISIISGPYSVSRCPSVLYISEGWCCQGWSWWNLLHPRGESSWSRPRRQSWGNWTCLVHWRRYCSCLWSQEHPGRGDGGI